MVNLINGIFSYLQERRAEKATKALRKMLAIYSGVLRDGKDHRILAYELVPGNVILLAGRSGLSRRSLSLSYSVRRSQKTMLVRSQKQYDGDADIFSDLTNFVGYVPFPIRSLVFDSKLISPIIWTVYIHKLSFGSL
jgi:P-type Ca2+ transporter type 2C